MIGEFTVIAEIPRETHLGKTIRTWSAVSLSLCPYHPYLPHDTRNRSMPVPQELLLDIAPLIALARKGVGG